MLDKLLAKKEFNVLMQMSQNGQTHFKNLATNAGRFLKCVRPF